MWLGYPGTSGSSFMEYIITDAVTSPLEQVRLTPKIMFLFHPPFFFFFFFFGFVLFFCQA
jgi:protein O-GlcNAc transferase